MKLENVYRGVKLVAVVGVCVVIGILAVVLNDIREVIPVVTAEAIEAIEATGQTMAEIQQTVDDTSRNANALLIQLGLAANIWRRSSEEQAQYWDQIAVETSEMLAGTNRTLAELAELTNNLDFRLNTQTLPAIEVALTSTSEQIGAVAVDVSRTLETLTLDTIALLQSSNEAMLNAAAVLGDENIVVMLETTKVASENTAAATFNIREATGFIADMLRPTERAFWLKMLDFITPRITIPLGR